jgi:uncharacterized protein YbjT (DUF2867 family)
MSMILVTGATGNIGREVVKLLQEGDEYVVAITRHPASAALPKGVIVVGGDPSHPQTLVSGLPRGGEGRGRDLTTIFISPRALGDDNPGAAAVALLKLAAERGAQRVVTLSAVTVEFGGGYRRFADAFRAVEDAVKASGLQWTILRCAEFDSNALAWAPQIRATGVVRGAYGDAASSPIHNRDVAAVSAVALMNASHAGHTYVLTGPQSLTQRERVRLIGEAIGKAILWVETSPQQVRESMLAQGLPPEIPDRLLGYLASLDQRAGPSSTTVQQLLGRSALTFAQWAMEHATAFRN